MTSSMSLRLRQITMVRCCLTALTGAASLWSKVWGSLALTGDGSVDRWKTFRRNLATEMSISCSEYVNSMQGVFDSLL